jgi:hypothetical protein
MAQARGFVPKAKLTPKEKLTCAYYCIVRGITQHDMAGVYGVNPGRVAEAITAVKAVIERENEP